MTSKYYEVIVEGSYELAKGFVLGYLEGKGIEGEAVFEQEYHIKSDRPLGQLLRMLNVKGDEIRVIIGEGVGLMLREAVEKRKTDLGLKVASIRLIKGARFNFRYKTFSKEFGGKLKETFADLPPGVQISGYDPEEIVRPKAKGVEAYAPLHEYEIKASGEVNGPAREVIDFYDRVEHNELIELEEIRLEYA
ncbi:MAG TPA: hypothetical protein PLR20_13420 [Syntrophales bacterium]|nr:hypothetical protein [Syntrophales bacterium]HOX95244.1 hypothetical protein [Syntrophales bacterium]HPI57765.1 hypothetical protein [Syntrophales bacterium]HPN25825.1 hypothetical protein [Syntrophales bacterium]HQM30345.1 hypothetical protein [Syntrophales bacterium]